MFLCVCSARYRHCLTMKNQPICHCLLFMAEVRDKIRKKCIKITSIWIIYLLYLWRIQCNKYDFDSYLQILRTTAVTQSNLTTCKDVRLWPRPTGLLHYSFDDGLHTQWTSCTNSLVMLYNKLYNLLEWWSLATYSPQIGSRHNLFSLKCGKWTLTILTVAIFEDYFNVMPYR